MFNFQVLNLVFIFVRTKIRLQHITEHPVETVACHHFILNIQLISCPWVTFQHLTFPPNIHHWARSKHAIVKPAAKFDHPTILTPCCCRSLPFYQQTNSFSSSLCHWMKLDWNKIFRIKKKINYLSNLTWNKLSRFSLSSIVSWSLNHNHPIWNLSHYLVTDVS